MGARRLRGPAVVLALVVGLAACTGGSGNISDETGEGAVRYLVPEPDDPEQLKKIQADVEVFQSQNPDIPVELTAIPLEELRTLLQAELRSGDGPDVFSYDTGPGFAGMLAESGLLYDLTGVYAQKDWAIYDWAKERVTFDGRVVGVPDQVEELGIYYNREVFEEHGLGPPTSLDDLFNISAVLAGNGRLPFAFGNEEGWEGGHLLSMALSSAVGPDGMKALLSGERRWDSPEVVFAIDVFFNEFQDAGFLPPDPNAVDYSTANAMFYSGDAAMLPTGTWLVTDIEDNTDFEIGFFPFPAPDGHGIFSGGLGAGTFISANTEDPEAALEFLSYLTTPEHGRWQVEELGTIPAYAVDIEGIAATPLFTQVLEDTREIASGTSSFGYNIDVLAGGAFNRTMWTGLQAVLGDDKTAGQLGRELQAAFQASSPNS